MTDLDNIINEWDIDCKIDPRNLIEESIKIPRLHHKYYKLMLIHSKLLRKQEDSLKKLEYTKWLYYQGKLDKTDLDKYGWEQFDLKVLKTDLQKVLDADDDISIKKQNVADQKDIIEYLKSILQNISNRSYLIGHAIESQKLEIGLT